MPSRSTFTLTLRDDAAHDRHGPDVHTRLRRLLKIMLRGFGFKCVEITVDSVPNQEVEHHG